MSGMWFLTRALTPDCVNSFLINAGVPKKCSSESVVLFLDAFLLPLRMVMHLSLNHLKWAVFPVSWKTLLVSDTHYCGAQESPLVAVLGATAVVFNSVNQGPQTFSKGPESRYFRLCRPYKWQTCHKYPTCLCNMKWPQVRHKSVAVFQVNFFMNAGTRISYNFHVTKCYYF